MPAAPKPKRTPQKKRFHARRDPAYQAFVRQQPCLLRERRIPEAELIRIRAFIPDYGWYAHLCWGPVQVCHIKSRAAAGADHANIVPLCAGAHDEQGRGIKTFERKWGLDLKVEAAELWERYQAEQLGDMFMRAFE